MRTVALLAYDGAQVLGLMGPAEVFYVADQLAGGGTYGVDIVSADGRDTVSASGLRMGVASSLGELDGPIDTLLIPGTPHWERLMEDDALRSGARAGAFLLGSVGLLEGRRATTHWLFLDDLAERFPATIVERNPIFVGDGRVFTCAGVTAGIDLALALVEADHGPDLTRQVAQFLVVSMQSGEARLPHIRGAQLA